MGCNSADKIVAIFGSVNFWGSDSPALCQAIGKCLPQMTPHIILVTGGNGIVHDVIAKSFVDELKGKNAKVFHLIFRMDVTASLNMGLF